MLGWETKTGMPKAVQQAFQQHPKRWWRIKNFVQFYCRNKSVLISQSNVFLVFLDKIFVQMYSLNHQIHHDVRTTKTVLKTLRQE